MSRLDEFFNCASANDIIDNLSKYDFRLEYLKRSHLDKITFNGKEFDVENLKSEDTVEVFITYKVFSKKTGFDADNSNVNVKCELMGEIYEKLWGAKKVNGRSAFLSIEAFNNKKENTDKSSEEKVLLFGGDVYNSILTKNGKPSLVKAVTELCSDESQKLCSEIKEKLGEMLKVSHILGNFGLVPAYFNPYRYRKFRDYMSDSLEQLKKEGFNYLNEAKGIIIKEQNKYRNFMKYDFNKYINIMFLWDYIEKDESGEIHICKLNNKNLNDWAEITPKIIKRRSLFMSLMLYFSVRNPAAYEIVINDIKENENIIDYEAVFSFMEEDDNKIPFSDEEKVVITNIKDKIKKITL